MKEILCKIFGFLKYILLIVAFGLVFFGIMSTFGRLEKPLTDGIDVFIPFVFVLVVFLINMFIKGSRASKSLLFNLVSVLVFVVTIIICLRSMFDTNMILYHRYGIDFNPSFFSDNLAAIKAMLYMIGGANVIMIICDLINRPGNVKKQEKIVVEEEMKKTTKRGRKPKEDKE